MTSSERAYSAYLSRRRKDGLERTLTHVEYPEPGIIRVNGRRYVNISSNDYLGLSKHPALVENAAKYMEHGGCGAGASRLVTGNLEQFHAIEAKIAAAKGKGAALVLASGFQANTTILEALFDKQALGRPPIVFSDKLNHASMHMGCKAANVRQIRYRHASVEHLAELLDREQETEGQRFILTESVFSMDGDRAPLDDIAALAKEHDAILIIDDAHAAGVLGPLGAGLGGPADIVIGTFSKAYGSFGAYVACPSIIRDYLINRCAGLIYSTALPPQVLGAIDAALDQVPEMENERRHLAKMAAMFREGVKSLGYDTGKSTTQIVPLIIGSSETAITLSNYLKDNGFWVTAIRPPTVPAGTARLRFAFSAAHKEVDLDRLLALLAQYQTEQMKSEIPAHS